MKAASITTADICSADQFWSPCNLLFDVYQWVGHEGDHISPSSAKAKNEVTLLIPLYSFKACTGTTLLSLPFHHIMLISMTHWDAALKMACSHAK